MHQDPNNKASQPCNDHKAAGISGNTSQATELISETILLWKKRTGMDASDEDAREMIENMSGFFLLLNEWDLKVKRLSVDGDKI